MFGRHTQTKNDLSSAAWGNNRLKQANKHCLGNNKVALHSDKLIQRGQAILLGCPLVKFCLFQVALICKLTSKNKGQHFSYPKAIVVSVVVNLIALELEFLFLLRSSV